MPNHSIDETETLSMNHWQNNRAFPENRRGEAHARTLHAPETGKHHLGNRRDETAEERSGNELERRRGHPPLSIRRWRGVDTFEQLDSTLPLSVSLSFPFLGLSSPSLCLATSQPFLRRFESRASQRNALMRTWLPSHFPLSLVGRTPTVAEAADRERFPFFPTTGLSLSLDRAPAAIPLSPAIDMRLVKFARDTGYSWIFPNTRGNRSLPFRAEDERILVHFLI